MTNVTFSALLIVFTYTGIKTLKRNKIWFLSEIHRSGAIVVKLINFRTLKIKIINITK